MRPQSRPAWAQAGLNQPIAVLTLASAVAESSCEGKSICVPTRNILAPFARWPRSFKFLYHCKCGANQAMKSESTLVINVYCTFASTLSSVTSLALLRAKHTINISISVKLASLIASNCSWPAGTIASESAPGTCPARAYCAASRHGRQWLLPTLRDRSDPSHDNHHTVHTIFSLATLSRLRAYPLCRAA